eukprot:11182415-Lingulodinium_polyedra.AAC.1
MSGNAAGAGVGNGAKIREAPGERGAGPTATQTSPLDLVYDAVFARARADFRPVRIEALMHDMGRRGLTPS